MNGDRSPSTLLEVCSHVLRELDDELRLRRHLALLQPRQVARRAHLPGPAGLLRTNAKRHAAVLFSQHDPPRPAHALLVPRHVAAINETTQWQEELGRAVNASHGEGATLAPSDRASGLLSLRAAPP